MPRRLLAPFLWVWGQLAQIYRGLRDQVVSWEFIKTLVPQWVLKYTIVAVPNALWGETPKDQIHGSLILIGWSIATGLFTGMVTAVFVFFWGIFLMIGILRYSSAGSGAWNRVTDTATGGLPGRGSDGSYSRRSRRGR